MRHRLHTDVSTELHSVELEKSMLERAVEEDAQRERAKLDDAQTKLAKIQARRTNQATVQEARARRDLREIRRDLKLEEVRFMSVCLSMYVCLYVVSLCMLCVCLYVVCLSMHVVCMYVCMLSVCLSIYVCVYIQYSPIVRRLCLYLHRKEMGA